MIQVDANYTYIVNVGWDLGFKHKTISNLPTKSLREHEFGCVKDMNEYIELMRDVNEDKMGTFYWEIRKRPIDLSTKYKQIEYHI